MDLMLVGMMVLMMMLQETSTERGQACDLLIAVDDPGFEQFGTKKVMKQKIDKYVSELNKIYQSTILAYPPNDNIYFKLKEIRRLENWLPGCENKGVILKEFSKVGTSEFCLAHLLTFRDFGCVVGLANIGGLCKKYGNTGWTKVDQTDSTTINTMAHEIGHNFGSDHDGGERLEYKGCGEEGKAGIMGGKKVSNFSTCSLAAMHARLQAVLKQEQKQPSCLKLTGRSVPSQTPPITSKNYNGYSVPCPKIIDTDCPDDQPDPPESPPPPPEPVCGDFEVFDPVEECDCGPLPSTCSDPCCYPANITVEDLQANSSAQPCTRHTQPRCLEPYTEPLKFGMMYPFIFLLLLIALLALILWIDWRYGKRWLYFHITERDARGKDALHVEDDKQRDRRVQREREKERLKQNPTSLP